MKNGKGTRVRDTASASLSTSTTCGTRSTLSRTGGGPRTDRPYRLHGDSDDDNDGDNDGDDGVVNRVNLIAKKVPIQGHDTNDCGAFFGHCSVILWPFFG